MDERIRSPLELDDIRRRINFIFANRLCVALIVSLVHAESKDRVAAECFVSAAKRFTPHLMLCQALCVRLRKSFGGTSIKILAKCSTADDHQ